MVVSKHRPFEVKLHISEPFKAEIQAAIADASRYMYAVGKVENSPQFVYNLFIAFQGAE